MNADAELLLGILAFQLNFVDRAKLLAAFDAWAQQPQRPLGQILIEQQAIRPDECELLEALRQKPLGRFDQDVAKSLAALTPVAEGARQELEAHLDQRLHASLAQVGADRVEDEFRTEPWTVGQSRSDGARFRILRPHAKGGLGEVYVAEDEELHREVALKRIQNGHADHPESRARFVQEAEITGGLEHPSIVPVYGLGTYADGRPYYAMRFIRGDSLKDAIRKFHRADARPRDPGDRTLQLRKLLQRFIDVCNAIEYAHSRGVLHRDLKPGNIMLGKYGETLAVDWGLAKAIGKEASQAGSEERTLKPSTTSGSAQAQYGSVLGTPEYMSPEQAAGRLDELGPASDVYSLGATLYHLLVGKPPFESSRDDLGERLARVGRADFPPPRQIASTVPQALEAICLRAMARQTSDRYPSARALADDIEHWLADEPVTTYHEPRVERLRRWSRKHRTAVTAAGALLATAILALTVGLFAIFAEQRRTEEQRKLAEQKQVDAEEQRKLAVRRQSEAEAARASEAIHRRNAEDQQRLAEEQRKLAEKNLLLANEQRRLAEWRHEEVRTAMANEAAQRRDAEEQRRLAEERKDRVEQVAFVARIQAADASWQANDAGAARQYLDACPINLRGWEFNYLYTKFNRGQKTLRGHTSSVRSVAFSPNGKRIVSGSDDDSIKVWDSETSRENLIIPGHKGGVRSVAFSPDGMRIVSCGEDDMNAKVWNAETGQGALTLRGHTKGILSVAFSPDGMRIASGSWDHTAKVWNAETGKEALTLRGHGSGVQSVAFSPDGTRVVSGSNDGTIKVWNAETGLAIFTLSGHAGHVWSVAFSPDGKRIVSGSHDNTAKVWNAETGRETRTLRGHASP